MLVHFDRATSAVELKEALETGSAEEKADAMKKVISLLLSGGDPCLRCSSPSCGTCSPSEDHTVQKLLLLYMETIEKCGPDGKILPEENFVVSKLEKQRCIEGHLRRGTLRFLCRITEHDLLEPLIPSIVQNLEHRHSYVRRNAVMAIHNIYELPATCLNT